MDNGLLVGVVIETNISLLRRFKEDLIKKRVFQFKLKAENVKKIKFMIALMLL